VTSRGDLLWGIRSSLAAQPFVQKHRPDGRPLLETSSPAAFEASRLVNSRTIKGPSAVTVGHQSNSRPRVKLANLLRAHRETHGLSRRSLAQQLGIRTSRLAVLENGRRKPSLWLIVRLAAVLQMDGMQLLALARPEAEPFLEPYPAPAVINQSWRRLLNSDLLARHHVTSREREALECLALLGGTVTRRALVAILMLIRDLPRLGAESDNHMRH
jgi:DNA-binding XRE family transcriptional regulator